MCTVCGCSAPSPDVARHDHGHGHHHHHHHSHDHGHHHDHDHDGDAALPCVDGLVDAGAGTAGLSVPGLTQERIVRIERDILSKNNAYAAANRSRLVWAHTLALNLMSSPGAGKTTLLCRAIDDLKQRFPIVVIEGDQETSNDAERIRATGARAVQVNTGKGCHLDGHMVGHALDALPLEPGGLLFIENVGNLVCPAAFDLGESYRVVVLSVTEGEDKPLKYPDMFASSDLLVLTKADLLPHLDFDLAACKAAALKVNPRLQILTVSARSGEGLDAFYAWIAARTLVPAEQSVAPA